MIVPLMIGFGIGATIGHFWLSNKDLEQRVEGLESDLASTDSVISTMIDWECTEVEMIFALANKRVPSDVGVLLAQLRLNASALREISDD